jgi:hypothetical protein
VLGRGVQHHLDRPAHAHAEAGHLGNHDFHARDASGRLDENHPVFQHAQRLNPGVQEFLFAEKVHETQTCAFLTVNHA